MYTWLPCACLLLGLLNCVSDIVSSFIVSSSYNLAHISSDYLQLLCVIKSLQMQIAFEEGILFFV